MPFAAFTQTQNLTAMNTRAASSAGILIARLRGPLITKVNTCALENEIKFAADARTAYLLHHRSLKEGRCRADLIRRAVAQYLAIEPADEPDAAVERVEFEHGAKATACYLSGPISAAVRKLAADRDRSQSYIVGQLLRHVLTEMGMLPTTTTPMAAPNPPSTVGTLSDNTADAETAK